jgi:hypothetical protein
MLHNVLLAVIVALSASTVFAQNRIQLSDWQTFSSLQATRSASIDSRQRIWCGTTGGLFVLNIETNELSTYRNINALLNLDVSMVKCDPSTQTVYVGSEDGSLAVVSEDGDFANVTEIRRATQYQRRGLTDCVVLNNTVFFSTQFGIVSFDRQRGVFMETIDRIGTLQRNIAVNAITIHDGRIWAATDSGLVSAPINAPTLRQPSVWTRYSSNEGIPPAPARAVRVIHNQLYTAIGSRLYLFREGTFEAVAEAPTPILSIAESSNLPSYATSEGVFAASGFVYRSSHPLVGHIALPGRDEDFVLLTAEHGLSRGRNGSVIPIDVNSPRIRQFMSVAVDDFGRIWAGSYNEAARTGQGISVFDGATWFNASNEFEPDVRLTGAYRLSSLSDGSIVVGTWGGGAYLFTDVPGRATPTIVSPSTSPVIGIAADTNFVLVGEAIRDPGGTLWMVNEQALDRALIAMGSSSAFAFRNCFDVRSNLYRSMAIDFGGTKWLGSPYGFGLLVYNERGTFDQVGDDLCQRLTTSNSNLPDNAVTAVRTDNNGTLWIGTARGVAAISSPGSVSASTVPFVRRISVLGAVVVNDLTVDALNNKWVATPDGVFVLSEDGTEVLATITSSNSPLVSNNVRSIVVDPRSGRVWFGTTEGLSSAQSQSIRPLANYDVRCYPQPFRPGSGLLTIDGFASDTDVRIMTMNGHLVTAMQTRGRQVLWDGRDTTGRLVPPGVYLVHVVSTSNQTSTVAKVAISR